MRLFQWTSWPIALVLLSLILSSSTRTDFQRHLNHQTRIVRVAILPICNPGTSCEPEVPKILDKSFFRSSFSVATFLHEVSSSHTLITGTTLPWLRPKTRIRSTDELITRRDELLSLVNPHTLLTNFDVYFFHITIAGLSQSFVHVEHEHALTIAYMVNSEIYAKPVRGKIQSAIAPSTPWALALLRSIGVSGDAHTLACDDDSALARCFVQRNKDPYSILGDTGFALTPSMAQGRSTLWSEQGLRIIDKDGLYRIDLSRAPQTTFAIALTTPLRLNDTMQFDRLFIEHRQFTRFDRTLWRLHGKDAPQNLSPYVHGAFLYLSSSENPASSTLLIDTHPRSASDATGGRSARLLEFSDTALLQGQSFRVFESAITLKVTHASATALTISVAGLAQ